MYYLNSLYSTLVILDRLRALMTSQEDVPLISRVSRELVVTWSKK